MASFTSTGGNPFGSKVAQLPTPNPYGDLSSVYPNLGQTNAAASGAVLSKLRGELSPETLANIQNAAASFGVSSGMPGSGLQIHRNLRDLGLSTEALQQQGLQDYNSLIPTVSGTQTVRPELQHEINLQNALDAASPDPSAAASYAQEVFKKYLNSMNSPAGGTGAFADEFGSGSKQTNQPFIGTSTPLPEPFFQYS
jgi:hypothetical protein